MLAKPVKKHWYLLSFSVQHPGAWIPASFVHGFETMRITVPEIRLAKQLNHITDNSVMIAVCYMGLATEREINGVPEIDPPSHTSDSFREGMAAAMKVSATDSIQPVNPYSFGPGAADPQNQHAAAEWQSGFTLTRESQQALYTTAKPEPVGDTPTVLEAPRKQPTK